MSYLVYVFHTREYSVVSILFALGVISMVMSKCVQFVFCIICECVIQSSSHWKCMTVDLRRRGEVCKDPGGLWKYRHWLTYLRVRWGRD